MSGLEKFLASPWLESHPAFQQSELSIYPAPEFANSEVVLSGLMRKSGFINVAEDHVYQLREYLDRVIDNPPSGGIYSIEINEWRSLLHSTLRSPKRPSDSRRRPEQFTPLIPVFSAFSGTARVKDKNWSPGNLIARMVLLGSDSQEAAAKTWTLLHRYLEVGSDDDLWARWLNKEFEVWKLEADKLGVVKWEVTDLDKFDWKFAGLDGQHLKEAHTWYPARAFVQDLHHVLLVKPVITRRQWTSLLDSILRIGASAHILWLCVVTDHVWQEVSKILNGNPVPDQDALRKRLYPTHYKFLDFNRPAMRPVKELIKKYLYARLYINTILHALLETHTQIQPLSSSQSVASFLTLVHTQKDHLKDLGVQSKFQELQSRQFDVLSCSSRGIGNNMVEFTQYVLGQRQTHDASRRAYDQGYFIRKQSQQSQSPWIVQMGSVAIYAMVHCCLSETKGSRSVARLSDHLGRYGLRVPHDAVAGSDLGEKLRTLSLVIDSPDAESGMLLIPPFENAWKLPEGDVA